MTASRAPALTPPHDPSQHVHNALNVGLALLFAAVFLFSLGIAKTDLRSPRLGEAARSPWHPPFVITASERPTAAANRLESATTHAPSFRPLFGSVRSDADRSETTLANGTSGEDAILDTMDTLWVDLRTELLQTAVWSRGHGNAGVRGGVLANQLGE
jgi:hypothetical protein